MAIITTNTVKAAISEAKASGADVWKTEDAPRGEGRLRLRARPGSDSVLFYFRYSFKGEQVQIPLDADSLAEARGKANEFSKLYRAGHHDLRGHLADLKAEAEARKAEAEAQRRIDARQGSFGQLLDAYVEDMERRGKVSAKEVSGALKLDVLTPFPELADQKAKEVTPYDISAILSHCINRPVASKGRGKRLTKASATNGKLRMADKLRSYLQSAFAFGLANDLNPLRKADAVQYGLVTNPACDIKPIEGANRAETWALTKDELKAVLAAIEDLPERRRAIAKAMLYLAGQRVEMLCRVTWADLFDDNEHGPVMRLVDRKGGKGTPPREHLLPITKRLGEILSPLLESDGEAPGPFSLRGTMTIAPDTALGIWDALGKELAQEGKTRKFTWRNMRATCETRLAELGVNQERRAWLLSHGRSGVQAKHYDRWNYLPEKHADLERWARYLDELGGKTIADNVVQFHRKV